MKKDTNQSSPFFTLLLYAGCTVLILTVMLAACDNNTKLITSASTQASEVLSDRFEDHGAFKAKLDSQMRAFDLKIKNQEDSIYHLYNRSYAIGDSIRVSVSSPDLKGMCNHK